MAVWIFLVIWMILTTVLHSEAFSSWQPRKHYSSFSHEAHKTNHKRLSSAIRYSTRFLDDIVTRDVMPAEDELPWSASINPLKPLTYMNFFTHQLEKLQQLGFSESSINGKFKCKDSSVKPARIGNKCFTGGKFRKVRMTYFDAGENVQVFNTLWYPRYEYDLPLFGVDLIALGKNRVVTVIDCQPLYPTSEYASKHIDYLSPIRDKYIILHGQLSGKIYSDTSFFSSQMLFGRFADDSHVIPSVYPAFQEYLNAYLQHADEAVPNADPVAMATVAARQEAYDMYSALKDPAVGLFDAYFGKDWSHEFVQNFLFTLSKSNQQDTNINSCAGQCSCSALDRAHKFKVNDVTGEISLESSQFFKNSNRY